MASHCESSPDSFDECKEVTANPRAIQPTWTVSLPEKAAIICFHHRHLLLLSLKADTHTAVEGWVDRGTAVRVCTVQPVPYITVAVVINTIPAVRFEHGFCHTTVRHVTTRPLQLAATILGLICSIGNVSIEYDDLSEGTTRKPHWQRGRFNNTASCAHTGRLQWEKVSDDNYEEYHNIGHNLRFLYCIYHNVNCHLVNEVWYNVFRYTIFKDHVTLEDCILYLLSVCWLWAVMCPDSFVYSIALFVCLLNVFTFVLLIYFLTCLLLWH